jgi:FtsH-binding integral membrane protein
MSYSSDLTVNDLFVADAAVEARAVFIRRTYLHLSAAILTFIGLETLFLSTPAIYEPLLRVIGGNWWMVLIAFMVVSWIAQSWAHNSPSKGMQYMGLGLFTLAEAVIFVPLLWVAQTMGPPNVIPAAAILTMMIFCGLTAVVMLTKADFSYLRGFLWVGTFGALGVIIAGALFGFTLGIFFSGAMIVLFSGWILYDTSKVLHHYRLDQYVGAALELFASVAMLFWYVLRLLMALRD